MKLTLTGRHFEITPHLKRHVREKVKKLEKLNDHNIEGEIIFSKDHVNDIAEGRIHYGHFAITAKGEATDMYAAVSDLVDKMLTQLQRHEDKLRDRRRLSPPRGE